MYWASINKINTQKSDSTTIVYLKIFRTISVYDIFLDDEAIIIYISYNVIYITENLVFNTLWPVKESCAFCS